MTLLAAAATTLTVEGRSAMHADQIPASLGKVAGEALLTAAPCYIKQSDGLVYMSNGTANNEAASIDGWTGKSYAIGEPVSLWGPGIIFQYGASLTPGATYYLGTTKGRLDTAPTAGDGVGCARAINATHIRVTRAAPLGGTTDASVGTADLAPAAVTFDKAAVFVSTEQTGTGSAQNVAHGLAAVPAGVLIVPTDTAPATVGVYTAVEGTHTTTNVVVTVTSGKKFKVFAWA
jgi:hypothetical protein